MSAIMLSIAGLTVEVQIGASERDPERIGAVVRSFNGRLRREARAIKRAFDAQTVPLDDTHRTALLAAIGGTQGIQTCAGDLLGASLSCYIEVTGQTPIFVSTTEEYTILTLSLREV